MTISTIERASDYPVVIDGTALPNVVNVTPSEQVSQMIFAAGGSLAPLGFATAYKEPICRVDTFDLKTLIDTIGIDLNNGLNCSSNSLIQFQNFADGGGPSAGATHWKLTSAKAFAHIERIIATQDDERPAMASVLLNLLESGGAEPNVAAGSASLTGTIALANKYALGELYINSVLVGGLMVAEYTSNLQFQPIRASGDTVAGQGHIIARNHAMACRVMNMSTLTTYGMGLSAAPGACALYFRHVPAGGGRTADTGVGNDLHVKINFPTAMLNINDIDSGGEDGAAQPNLIIQNTGAATITTTSHIP